MLQNPQSTKSSSRVTLLHYLNQTYLKICNCAAQELWDSIPASLHCQHLGQKASSQTHFLHSSKHLKFSYLTLKHCSSKNTFLHSRNIPNMMILQIKLPYLLTLTFWLWLSQIQTKCIRISNYCITASKEPLHSLSHDSNINQIQNNPDVRVVSQLFMR